MGCQAATKLVQLRAQGLHRTVQAWAARPSTAYCGRRSPKPVISTRPATWQAEADVLEVVQAEPSAAEMFGSTAGAAGGQLFS